MVNDLRQAAQQALEVMHRQGDVGVDEWIAAEKALRAALAEQPAEQEPVAVVSVGKQPWNAGLSVVELEQPLRVGTKLYTAPQPAKPAEQEPVAAWENKYGMKEWEVHALRAGWMPASPQPHKRLTDEEIKSFAMEAFDSSWDADDETLVNKYGHGVYLWRFVDFARAIEDAIWSKT